MAACSENADVTERLLDYRFDEPWDNQANFDALLVLPMYVFQCPSESRRIGYPFTSYLMLVRPTDDVGTRPLPSDAVLVVESAECGIKQTEPKDLQWEALWKVTRLLARESSIRYTQT